VQSGVELLDFSVEIYDRWGNPIFSTTDQLIGWDGTFNNNEVPINSYVYVVEYSTELCDASLHSKVKTGTITLLR